MGSFIFEEKTTFFGNTILTILKTLLSWYLEDLGTDGIIILKWFIKIQNEARTVFIWLTTQTSGGLL